MKKIGFKRAVAVFAAALITVTALTACEGSNKIENETPPYPVTVNSVTVERAPKAVASLDPSITKMLIDLGFLKRIVGYSNGEVLPEPPPEEPVSSDTGFRWFWEPKPEPYVPEPMPESGEIGTAIAPSYEAIAKYLPEIIFTTLPLPSAEMEKLAEVSIKVIVLDSPKTMEALIQNYRAIYRAMAGEVLAEKEGQPIIDELNRQLSHISSVVPQNRVSVLYICTEDMIVATNDTYEGAMLKLLADNVAGDAIGYSMTEEQLADCDPDIILYPEDLDPAALGEKEALAGKTAVLEGKLYPISKNILTDKSLSLVESIQALGAILYPGVDFTVPEPVVEAESEAGMKDKKDKEDKKDTTEASSGGESEEASSATE